MMKKTNLSLGKCAMEDVLEVYQRQYADNEVLV